MNDDQLLFRELRSLLQSDGGKRRFCAAVVSRGQSFLANANALRIAIMATMPYRLYLLTEHWRRVSREAKERAGNRCQLCNSPTNIETHHRTYERRGHEEPEDLTVLCSECHGKFHTQPTPDDYTEPAASDPIAMRFAGMTEQEEAQCLAEMIAAKRREQGINPDGIGRINEPSPKQLSPTLHRKLKSLPASSSTRRR